MKECDCKTLSTLAWSLVNQTNTLSLGISQLLLDILASESHVVNTYATILDILSNCRILRCGLQKLNLCLADLKERSLNLLVSNLLDCITLSRQYRDVQCVKLS